MTQRGITAAQVAGVAAEIDALRGFRVLAAHEDGPARFRLSLRDGSDRQDVRIVLESGFPYIAVSAPTRAPLEPSALARSLRSLLGGAQLVSAAAVSGERALAVRMQRGDVQHTLWVELFGHQANLYVIDPEGCVALTPRGDVAKRRGSSRGAPFEPVPPQEAVTPAADASAEVLRLASADASSATLRSVHTDVRRRLTRLAKQTRKRIHGFEAMEARASDAEAHRRRGELLQGAFHLLRPGLRTVRVPDYTTDPPTEVELDVDPDLPAGAQVAACFRAERKCRRAGEEARRRLPEARATLERLTAAQTQIEAASTVEEVAAACEAGGVAMPDATRGAAAARGTKGPTRAQPWRAFRSRDGWIILVGKSARGNDELTLRKARPWDLFVHVRGASGSHVIVPTDRGKSVPKETLLDAAELACLFSERKSAERNEVDYVEKRHVRKPRGSPPGRVAVERSRTLSMRLDTARRARLLASAVAPAG